MMQFFYDREVVVGKSEDGTTDLKETRRDSFNPDCVIRSYEFDKGKIAIFLNDGHEEAEEVPVMSNSGKVINTKRERNWVVSRILLNEQDTKRYRKYFDIEPMMLLNNESILEAHMEEDLILNSTEDDKGVGVEPPPTLD